MKWAPELQIEFIQHNWFWAHLVAILHLIFIYHFTAKVWSMIDKKFTQTTDETKKVSYEDYS